MCQAVRNCRRDGFGEAFRFLLVLLIFRRDPQRVVVRYRLKDSPTSSSLFFQSASALAGSSAYPRTPSLMALIVTSSGTTWPTWQFSQYRPPISSAGATTPAQTEVAAPCGMVFHWKGAPPSAARC